MAQKFEKRVGLEASIEGVENPHDEAIAVINELAHDTGGFFKFSIVTLEEDGPDCCRFSVRRKRLDLRPGPPAGRDQLPSMVVDDAHLDSDLAILRAKLQGRGHTQRSADRVSLMEKISERNPAR
jgi:hypothetical protein